MAESIMTHLTKTYGRPRTYLVAPENASLRNPYESLPRLEVHVCFLRDTQVYLRTRGLHGFDDSLEVKIPFCCIIFATAKHHECIAAFDYCRQVLLILNSCL